MGFNLSISNIGWTADEDLFVYGLMKTYSFLGLEIAPTRIFPSNPYEKIAEAKKWFLDLKNDYDFSIPSMQSIWFGKTERIFGTEVERCALGEYTKKAIVFAETIGCENLVFGCPRNRSFSDGEDFGVAVPFFKEIGDYAASHNTRIGMEANPPIYNTNYINSTADALELIKNVDSKGFLLNLDIGTMIENSEEISILSGNVNLINHVHISEPGLKSIKKRDIHIQLCKILVNSGYDRFISIEMGNSNGISVLEQSMKYVSEVFR